MYFHINFVCDFSIFALASFKLNYLGQVVFARFARKKGGEVVHFSAKPKNEPHSPLLCEHSEHEKLKMGLSYAHASIT
jgi:hypothetical protein